MDTCVGISDTVFNDILLLMMKYYDGDDSEMVICKMDISVMEKGELFNTEKGELFSMVI